MKKHYHVSIICLAALFFACAGNSNPKTADKGKDRETKALLSGRVSVNERDKRGRTPLHAAAETGNAEMVRFLIAMGAKVDALDNDGRTPLGISVSIADVESARLLTAAGADIHHTLSSTNNETPALLGARSGGPLLEALIHPQTLNSRGPGGLTLIHMAGQAGNSDSVRIITGAGALVNERDDNGKTALDYALAGTDSAACAEAAERLVLAGGQSSDPFYPYFAAAARSANYNIRAGDGYTALHYAAREGYMGYITFILGRRADINIRNNSGATALHEAVRTGRTNSMEMLIGRGADVNMQDAKGNSPLHLAPPENKHIQTADLLLVSGANPNLQDEHGETPLHVMITLGRSDELARRFLSGGSDVKARNIQGKTPLYLAVEYSRTDLIPLLLASGSDIFAADNNNIPPLGRALIENKNAVLNEILTEETVRRQDSTGNTPLHIAIRSKADVAVVELILNKNGEVNARNKEGNTPLHIANIENHEPAGSLLISRGADIFIPNSKGENPLYLAFHSTGSVRRWMLTQRTLEARDRFGNTALHYAAQWKLAAHVPLLIQNGSKPEAVNATGETPLFVAARADSPETIRALLAAGASINARDNLGNSPLHSAVRWNAQNSIGPLIEAGNNINAQNLAGKVPLHEAVRLGLTASENILITRKANLEIRDTDGNTPLMEAVQNGFSGSMERLANAGADPITRNNTGNTPLHIAVSMQRIDMITLLLTYGAPIHARNSSGITPFQIALASSPEMVSTLLTKDWVTIADDDGLSPLHIAIDQRAPVDIIRLMINRGCRISAVDSEGRTPLRLALDLNSLDEAKMLADAGSDVFAPAADGKNPATVALARGEKAVRALFSGRAINARDGTGNTVLHYAAQTGRVDLITVLLEMGASKTTKNIAAESPADIALRWNHNQAAAMLQ